MNKLYWMDEEGHVFEAVLDLNQEDFSDAMQELMSRADAYRQSM